MLLVGTTNGSIIAVGIYSSSEVSVALRTSAAAVLVRGHMGDVNNVACDSEKQVFHIILLSPAFVFTLVFKVVYTGSYDGIIRCWDLETKQCAPLVRPFAHRQSPLMLHVQAYSAKMSWSPSCVSMCTVATAGSLSDTVAAASAAGKRAWMQVVELKTLSWRPSTPPESWTLQSSNSARTEAMLLSVSTTASLTCTYYFLAVDARAS